MSATMNEQQPGKTEGMQASNPGAGKESNQPSAGKTMMTAYGKGAAEQGGKETVKYATDPESGAQEQIDKVKGWWAKTFPCFAGAV
ncbi:hypothetical protein BDZ89DRAFT_1128094 [Hymenopellis radicata]|nr:hypothetical protein BDZ89DRAFT_1128094 [Hymenopellis radicata]